MSNLLERIDALEAENRRFRTSARRHRAFTLMSLVAVISLFLFTGASLRQEPGVLTGRKLVIADGDNAEHIVLGAGPEGSAGVFIVDKKNHPRIGMTLMRSGQAMFDVRDTSLTHGIRIGAMPDGAPSISIWDRETERDPERVRLALGMSPDGSLFLNFSPKNDPKRRLFSVYTRADGNTALELTDNGGNRRAMLYAQPDGPGGLIIRDLSGKAIALTSYPNGRGGPSLDLFGVDNHRLAGLAVRTDGVPQLQIWDAEQNVLFRTSLLPK